MKLAPAKCTRTPEGSRSVPGGPAVCIFAGGVLYRAPLIVSAASSCANSRPLSNEPLSPATTNGHASGKLPLPAHPPASPPRPARARRRRAAAPSRRPAGNCTSRTAHPRQGALPRTAARRTSRRSARAWRPSRCRSPRRRLIAA